MVGEAMRSKSDGSGFSYEATIPSWTTGHSQGEDNVVYYVLEVKVFGGAGSDAPVVLRSVQRRFSDFRRLYDMLCMLYGQDKLAGKEVPELQASNAKGEKR